jgi:shikimate dehydrogenase
MREFGLIGHPLDHSFSGDYFKKKFLQENITDCDYCLYDILSLADLRPLIHSKNITGFNVTIPYKVDILALLDSIDDEAASIGAVNCVTVKDGHLRGFNTDVYGFAMSIKPFLENHYERALVLGTGGASKAVIHVLKAWGLDFMQVSRNPSSPKMMNYTDLNAVSIQYFPLIINTTPVGTWPDVEACPDLPYDALTEKHFLYDMVYNPALTTMLAKGKTKGCTTMNGLKMLELQAEKSWEFWNF